MTLPGVAAGALYAGGLPIEGEASLEAFCRAHGVAETPIDIAPVLALTEPVVRVRYELEEVESPGLGGILDAFVAARR